MDAEGKVLVADGMLVEDVAMGRMVVAERIPAVFYADHEEQN
jgi:hypothetical protein